VPDIGRKKQLIAIVDDDECVRSAVSGVLKSVGMNTRTFVSAGEFLVSGQHGEIACLITDIKMPGMTGLELQARLAAENYRIPIIFITAYENAAYGNTSMRMQALRAGAVEFLGKPFDDEALLVTVREALDGSQP
jgi:FixJ family two-component response regulator